MKPPILTGFFVISYLSVLHDATEHFCSEDCVMDISLATPNSNNGTTCSFSCPSGTGSITNPCTTTSTVTSTTTTVTTTTPTTTVTTNPAQVEGRCASIYKDNGTLYQSKCVIVDVNAKCNEDKEPVCECSVGYSGATCQVADQQLKEIEKLMGDGPEAAAEAQKVLQSIIDSKGSGGSATMIVNLPALLSFLTDEERIAMSYTANEVIAGATYEGHSLDPATDFVRITDPSLGNCFTFNHYNATTKYKIRRLGTGEGLRIELDSMPDEYAPWTDVVGMSVFVHPIGQELNIESNKYASIPGSADQLTLKKYQFHKIGKKCAKDTSAAQSFYLPGQYTVDGCYRACYQDYVFKQCQCMDASYARKSGVDGCKFGKLTCITEKVVSRGDPVKWDECKCPQPCDEETYDYIVSRSTHLRVDNANLTLRRSEVVLFFDSFQTSISKEVYRMSFSQVIGNIGGVAGLLLGITISFLVELFLLGVTLFSGACKSNPTQDKAIKSA